MEPTDFGYLQKFVVGHYDKIFINNEIRTRKYTCSNFLFRFIFEQFSKGPNIYFMFVVVLQHLRSSIAKHYSTLVGLALLEFVYVIKECLEDHNRKKYDNNENHKQYEVFNAQNQEFEFIDSENIHVGDILRVKNGDYLPSDILILQSSHADGNVYMTTSAVDGESGVKCFKAMDLFDPTQDVRQEIMTKVMHKKCARSPASNQINEIKLFFDYDDNNNNQQEQQQINHNKLAFRGFHVQHTECIYGLVVYTGKDTTMMQNVNGIQNKLSKLDQRVNKITYYMIISTFILTLATAIPVYFYKVNSPYRRGFEFSEQALGYLVIYASLSPLSIYSYVVVFEFIMMFQVQNDKAFKNQVLVNNEQVLPDLGNVDIVFTDKTGTLTENVMELEQVILPIAYHERTARIHSINDLSQKSTHNRYVADFFRTILVCNSSNLNPEFNHTQQQLRDNNNNNNNVMPKIAAEALGDYYLSTNQDDESLLIGALKCGYRVTKKSDDYQENIMRNNPGTSVRYTLFPKSHLEFNHDRKYQVMVVKVLDRAKKGNNNNNNNNAKNNDKYLAFAKGAFEKLMPMIGEDTLPDNIDELIDSFYRKCFRVLCFAVAKFDHLPTEAELVDSLCRKPYRFVALSGTEDRLAQGVQWTIESLMQANIRFVMLTGDNPITANNIAQSCRLVDKSCDKCVLEPANAHIYASDGSVNGLDFALMRPMQYNEYAIFDANMTKQVLRNGESFLKWSKSSKCLIFSRSTPDKKAAIVRLYKSVINHHLQIYDTYNTLAIGDGSNDVAMLREANLSIGIRGKEGLIASSSADISVDRFSRLKRLLLVHGAWNYFRASLGVLVFTYKNLASFLPILLFIGFSDFSLVKLFDDWLNIAMVFLFTSFSLLPVAAFDFQVNEANRMAYPKLYRASSSRKNYSNISMFEWIQNALIHGSIPFLLVYFGGVLFPFITHSGKLPSYQYISNLTLLSTLIVIIAKTQIMAHHISCMNCTMTCSSFVFYIIFILIPILNDPIDLSVKSDLFFSYQTYMLLLVITLIALIRDLIWIWCKRTIYWEQADLIRDDERGIHARFEAVPLNRVKQLVKHTGNSVFS